MKKGQKSPEKQISHDFRCEIDPCENTENTGSLSPYESPEKPMPMVVCYPPRKQEKMLENRSEGPPKALEGPSGGGHRKEPIPLILDPQSPGLEESQGGIQTAWLWFVEREICCP